MSMQRTLSISIFVKVSFKHIFIESHKIIGDSTEKGQNLG